MLIQHILQLKQYQPIELPVYDFSVHTRTEQTILIKPQRVIMVEGILILPNPNCGNCSTSAFSWIPIPDLRFIRRLQRDLSERGRTTESVIHQYLKTVRPMHLEFVEPSKRYADIIIPEGGFNLPALDMVVARIEEMLR